MDKTKLTFNRKQVRPTFLSHYCGEYTLPSGKMSGYYRFPITDEEINEACKWLDPKDKPKRFWTMSEWMLFTALRVKYGFNYLKPKQQQFLSHIDALYSEPKAENPLQDLEDKMISYCDFSSNEVLKIVLDKIANLEPARVSGGLEKNEKNFRASLDNSNFDVLY